MSNREVTKNNQIVPTTGELYYEPSRNLSLCQAQLMPLKSLNLTKLYKLQEIANKASMEYKKTVQTTK